MSSQATPANDKAPKNDRPPKAKDPKGLAPPDEKFWQRYSPHQELPLSGVSSFTLHFLGIGFLILIGMGIISLGSSKKAPVEAVQLVGGGGGHPRGDPNSTGPAGEAAAKEDVTEQPKPGTDVPIEKTQTLEARKGPDPKIEFKDNAERFIEAGNEAKKLTAGIKGPSRSGPGGSQGKGGSGNGPGDGPGSGPGGADRPPTQSEKRWSRWNLNFGRLRPEEFLMQLSLLGAVAAIPTDDGDPPRGYHVIRNLKYPPFRFKEEDIGHMRQTLLTLVPTDPDTVDLMVRALGLKRRISHFFIFLPHDTEKKFLAAERKYSGGRSEDAIEQTVFRIRPLGGGYEPYVESQTLR